MKNDLQQFKAQVEKEMKELRSDVKKLTEAAAVKKVNNRALPPPAMNDEELERLVSLPEMVGGLILFLYNSLIKTQN